MLTIPFAVFDVFGYLASGAVVLGGMQLLTGFPNVFGSQLSPFAAGAALLAMYVAGQVTSIPAELIVEKILARRMIGAPNVILFKPPKGWRALVFPGYCGRLPKATAKRVRQAAKDAGVTDLGEPLFFFARFSVQVTGDAYTRDRLGVFIAQYVFARNMAFSCLALAPFLLLQARWQHRHDAAYIAVAALVTGIALVYRFLKYYRLYSFEVFSRFGAHGLG